MLELLKQFFGIGSKADFAELVRQGAIIIDVRTKDEFVGGHLKRSINIPLNMLSNNLSKFNDKDKPIITCCASGMRSGSAKSILKSNGYTQVYNGGSWNGLENKI